jgi:alpha-beta hydrolase superfamily lysophospholipase
MAATQIWFGPSHRRLFGWFHLPDRAEARGGVVLCPPIGRDYLQAHYALRRLAIRLETAGFCVLRFDYDGTGDSAGAGTDPGRVEAWLDSVDSALCVVRGAGASWVALVGMRLGATLAAESARRDGNVDALVLWDPNPSGRAFLSQQRALAAVSLGVTPTRPDGSVEIPALVFDAETVRDLAELRIDADAGRLADHIVVLTRAPHDDMRLRAALASADVDWDEARGQSELIDADSPHQVLPDATIDRIVAWLSEHVGAGTTAMRAPDEGGEATVDAPGTDTGVVERPALFGPLGLFGLITEAPRATAGPTVVFLSVANEHHVGPNRLWVELARRLALVGLRSVRIDLSGLGDSPVRDGQPEFVSRAPWAFVDVADVARAVSPDDPSNIVLVGLCSAAYQAIESALELRPRGVVAINPVLSFQPPEVLAGDPLDPRRRIAWPRGAVVQSFHHQGPLSPLRRRFPNIGWRIRILMAPSRRSAVWLKELADAGVDLLLICGEREARPIHQGASARLLQKLARTGRLRFEFIPGLDHGLLRAEDRDRVSEMLIDHLRDRFGDSVEAAPGQAPVTP